jgi:hypothetical protein
MAETLTQIAQKMHPLTRLNLRNWTRMVLYPTGVRDFGSAVAEDLNLTDSPVGQFLKYSGTLFDGAKYFLYDLLPGTIIYQHFLKDFLSK